jgi:hypothetical protein
MNEPTQTKEGWFIETDDGKSGPWTCKEAAVSAGDGRTMQANILNNNAIRHNERTK